MPRLPREVPRQITLNDDASSPKHGTVTNDASSLAHKRRRDGLHMDDSFWARALEMTPQQYYDFILRYLSEKFLDPAQRRDAFNFILKSAAAIIEEGGEDEIPRLLPLAAFLESVGEPPAALVADFIPAQKLVCFSGAAKEGKSLITLQMLEDIACNQTMLGRFPIEKNGSVAYFGMEDGGHEIKARLTIRGRLDMQDYYICDTPFDMNAEIGWQTFLSLIDVMEKAPSLVVIDTAREAFSSLLDWNDAAKVGPTLKKLRRWAQKNCTVFLICHNNKDKFASGVNKVSGSGALVSSCDIVAILENQKILESGDLLWDYSLSGRGVRKSSYKMQMDTNTTIVRCLDDAEIADAETKNRLSDKADNKRRILDAAQELTEFQTPTLATELGMGQKYLANLVTELKRDGFILEGGKKRVEGFRNPLPVYVLANTGRDNNDDASSRTVPENGDDASSSDAETVDKSGLNQFFNDAPPEPEYDEL